MIIINRFGTTDSAVAKGDKPGHAFRGNQYGAGKGGKGKTQAEEKVEAVFDKGTEVTEIGKKAQFDMGTDRNLVEQTATASVNGHRKVANDIKAAGDQLRFGGKLTERISGAKALLSSAKQQLDKLPQTAGKNQLTAALSRANDVVSSL